MGNSATEILFAIIPNSGGIKSEPVYAEAICTPIIDCDFSLPKRVGVEWIMQGYTGAHPKPIIIKPAKANGFASGKTIKTMPIAIIESPILIRVLSLNFIDKNPFIERPTVIPI